LALKLKIEVRFIKIFISLVKTFLYSCGLTVLEFEIGLPKGLGFTEAMKYMNKMVDACK